MITIVYWLPFLVLLAGAGLFLFYPLFRHNSPAPGMASADANVRVYRQALDGLQIARDRGEIGQAEYDEHALELQRQLLLDADPLPGVGHAARKPALVAMGMAFLATVILASGIYSHLGARDQLRITTLGRDMFAEMSAAMAQGRQPDRTAARELAALLPGYLARHPEDLNSVYLLGVTWVQLGEFGKAAPLYKQYLLAVPTDEQALTEYVQVLYLAENEQLSEHVQFVVGRALALNPNNVDVLGLLAMHYYRAADYRKAVSYWKQILAVMPKDNPNYALVQNAIAEANKRTSKAKSRQKASGLP